MTTAITHDHRHHHDHYDRLFGQSPKEEALILQALKGNPLFDDMETDQVYICVCISTSTSTSESLSLSIYPYPYIYIYI
jgi:hypothetical protein